MVVSTKSANEGMQFIPKRCKDELEHMAEQLFGQIFSQ